MLSKTYLAGALVAILTLAGCSGSTTTSTAPPVITPVSPSPVATLSPASLVFPSTASGATSTPLLLTVGNSGSAALVVTGVAVSGTNAAVFAQTNTCGSVPASSSCAVSVTFTPTAASTTYNATLTVTDNTGGAAGSTQSIALSATSAAPALTPQATLSASTLSFSSPLGSTSAAQMVTLSNTGTATLTGIAISLSGSGIFAQTATTCGASLAAGGSCTISLAYTPIAAGTVTGTLSIADNASGSPQTVALSGLVASSSVSRTLLAFPEADLSVTPLYALINGAQKTIDMTMYALEDTTFTADLIAACKRGVTVRVILDQNLEKSGNTSAYNQLNAATNCSAVWANKAFQATHQKSFILDGTQVAIMSLNLQSQYYSTTRDYALIENDAADIAAIQATFNTDYGAGTPSSGVAGTSDFSYTPGGGDSNDLIWSPTTAQAAMLGLINNAKTSILLENEEMGAANIVSALEAAAQRGVSVKIAMVNSSSYTANFTALKAAGCKISLYANTTNGFYIHAKAVVADYGLSTQSVYMGSINYSLASMNNNRELGIYITDPASVNLLETTMTNDFAGGTPY